MKIVCNPATPATVPRPNKSSQSKPQPSLVETETVGAVCLALTRQPLTLLVRGWNWKTALLSACLRGSLFFLTNLGAGMNAALAAFAVEAACYALLAGFYGALLQCFRRARPAWAAALLVMFVLPFLNHMVEWVAHCLSGTPQLGRSMLLSIGFSLLSACFNLFAMRRGVLIVGHERRTFLEDLQLLPRVVAQFIAAVPLSIGRRA